jgi:hypothetical protein
MESFSWEQFDGGTFQSLCNALLLFEVSKFAFVFTAAGQDKGIDQLYQGKFDGVEGIWRFQDKFHNSGNKNSDISALKRDILEDIKSNYNGENGIIFLTNVNLGPGKYKEILQEASQKLTDLGHDNCQIYLWHQATLEGLLTNLPIVRHFFWEQDTLLLQAFKEYFKNPLNPKSADSRYQLINPFFGRKKESNAIKSFLEHPTSTMLAIIANGGFGKTRLVVEYFREVISKDHAWIPLVLSHTGFSPQGFNRLLHTDRRLLILVDDAHGIPSVINEIKRLADNFQGQHKIILTTRLSLFSVIVQSVSSLSKNFERLPLEKLEYLETKEMFKSELPRLQDHNINYLADRSKGIPFLILEWIRLIKEGKHPQEITEEQFFNDSISWIFKEAEKDLAERFYIPARVTNDFIRLISLIGPVAINDENLKFLHSFLGIRSDELERLVNELENLGLLEKRISISIKPDPYSDTILAQTINTNREFINRVIKYEGSDVFIENILQNLSESAIADAEKKLFIDNLLDEYILLINKTDTSPKKIKEIVELVSKIVIFKPRAGLLVVKLFTEILADDKHSIHKKGGGWFSKTWAEDSKEHIGKLLYTLCNHTQFASENKEEIHKIIEQYIRTIDDTKILFTCYSYHEWNLCRYDYHPRICCERQTFLAQIACKYLDDDDDEMNRRIALESARFLLELDFRLEEHYEPATMQFTYGEAQVPYCEHVKRIRISSCESLIKFYVKSINDLDRSRAMQLLLNYFYFATENSNKRYQQNINEEINLVLAFFISLLSDSPTTDEKSIILEKIRMYKAVKFKVSFQERVDLIEKLASSGRNLYEALELEIRNSDWFDARRNFEPRLLNIIDQYTSFELFARDLIDIKLKIGNQQSQFSHALDILGKTMPNESKGLFKEIQINFGSLIPDGIQLIKRNYKDDVYFTSVIEWLWLRRDVYIMPLLWLISNGRNKDRSFYKITDFEYYEYAIDNNNPLIETYVAVDLPEYAHLDKERTFILLDHFSKKCSDQGFDLLLMNVLDDKINYSADFKEELLTLFRKNSQKIKISEIGTSQILKFIDEKFGFGKLKEFVTNRIELLLNDPEAGWRVYDEPGYYRNPNLSVDELDDRYIELLEKSLHESSEGNIKNQYLLKIFRPSIILTKSLSAKIKSMADKFQTDSSSLAMIASNILYFVNSNREWIDVMCYIGEKQLINGIDKSILVETFGNIFTFNLGGKSKAGVGGPYNEDVFRKELLESFLEENVYGGPIKEFIESCLDKVKADMSETIEEDKKRFS